MPTSDDRPLDPLPPRVPVAREAVVTEPAVDPRWAVRMDERVRNLRTLAALASVLALTGLGVSLYSLLRDDKKGASRDRVARIDRRVDRLESRATQTADQSDASRLSNRIDAKAGKQELQMLRDDVAKLRTTVSQTKSGDSSATDATTKLGERIDRLVQQVDDLRTQSTP